MLVYGDSRRREYAADKLLRVREAVSGLHGCTPGLARHSALVGALIEAGELAQGVADAEFFERGGRDAASPAAGAAMALVMALARGVAASWVSGLADQAVEDVGPLIDACAARLPASLLLDVRQPEGYAFYALYPESYFAAARPLAGDGWQVIGIRSIGTSLAAMVAAALGAPPPLTLRPVGHPFAREIAADVQPDLQAGQIAIVDEGPGLSGSSMAAVASWLRQAAPQARLHFFPSHDNGPGTRATPAVQALWAATPRRVASFDDVMLQAPLSEQRLETWIADLVGPLRAPLREISGGAWRGLQERATPELPPVHPWQERRKFLAESASGRWLVKFAGLGRIGERKLERARALADAGYTPQPAGLCHGFLVERWRDDLRPLPALLPVALRTRLLAHLGDYLGFRAAQFGGIGAERGASLQQLHRMGRHNSGEAFGAAAAAVWDAWQPALAGLEGRVHRVETDNRLQPWEWLHGAGAILKADALDHHSAHDLVGCQDIAWDIAGAMAEFDLAAGEVRQLALGVAERCGRSVDRSVLTFLGPCYLAFQLGYWREAHAACGDAAEAARLRTTGDRYAARLARALAEPAFSVPAV